LLVGWVVVGCSVKVEVCMGRFAVQAGIVSVEKIKVNWRAALACYLRVHPHRPFPSPLYFSHVAPSPFSSYSYIVGFIRLNISLSAPAHTGSSLVDSSYFFFYPEDGGDTFL
jgi:hypothetical protein